MKMSLNEALETLNKAGFIAEGKLGRAIGIGALALGSLFGHGHALQDQYNFRSDNFNALTAEQKKEVIEGQFKTKPSYVKVKTNYVVTVQGEYKTFYITNDIESIPSNVTSITFSNDLAVMQFIYEDGSVKFFTYIAGAEDSGVISKDDEFGTTEYTKHVSASRVQELISKAYNLMMQNK